MTNQDSPVNRRIDFLDPDSSLAAALDSGSTSLLALAVLAHPKTSGLLEERTQDRLWKIGMDVSPPSRVDVETIRAFGKMVLMAGAK